MKKLAGKNIYFILTGAPKAKQAPEIIKELISEGANVFTIPTKSAIDFVDINKLKRIKGNIVKTDWKDNFKLPRENIVLIAPCTFNTLNLITKGIANNYPLCLIASAIGQRSPVFIAPSMNESLWSHPIISDNIKKLESWGCRIIWPSIAPGKTTMTDIGKILDTIYFEFNRISFEGEKIVEISQNKKLESYRNKYLKTFQEIGNFLKKNDLNLPTAGCMSVKVPEGFLISSSGCELSEMEEENITLVTAWNDEKNLVKWMGDNAPSSETPLHCVIHASKKQSLILHFHCPKITYSQKLKEFCSDKYQRYGKFNLGYNTIKLLDSANFYIMKYHGEVLIGDTVEEIKDSLIEIKGLA